MDNITPKEEKRKKRNKNIIKIKIKNKMSLYKNVSLFFRYEATVGLQEYLDGQEIKTCYVSDLWTNMKEKLLNKIKPNKKKA